MGMMGATSSPSSRTKQSVPASAARTAPITCTSQSIRNLARLPSRRAVSASTIAVEKVVNPPSRPVVTACTRR